VGDTWVQLLHRLAPLLSSALFGRLQAFPASTALSPKRQRDLSNCLQEGITALDSLYYKLTTFLPRYLLDLSPVPGEPYGELLEGSFIFADVTGFTALTGELSKQGTEGREEMNRLMRALFAAVLDPLLVSGGDLLIFAGDAVLARFPARPEGQDARWAARTALRLVRAIAPFVDLRTRYGNFSLTMSAGVERGRAFAAVVGTRQRMELLISGGPVQGAMQAEGEAEPGQVFVGPGALPYLSEEEFLLQGSVVGGLQGGELDDYEVIPPARRRRRISSIFSRSIPDLIEHAEQALIQVEALVPFIPPDLFSQIARGEDVRQHPPVAVQFVNILGLEDLALGSVGPERATAAFQRYFVQAQEIVADREGIISQVDPYARGFTLLNPFGAPTHHEGIPRLAASAALELARALDQVNQEFDLDPPLAQRTGLTYDRIFTGEIGYRHRREYVVAGPAVNLAARLMSKAESGQVVLPPAAWEAVRGDFVSDPLPAISLKGIPEPVPRFAVRGLRKGGGLRLTDYPLAGRREELAMLADRLEQAAAGQGGTLALIGGAGMGKSRLAVAVADAAHRQDMTVLAGRCRPFAQTTPYLPWADIVGHWFDLDEEMPPDERRQRVRERLADFGLAPSFPAFADLLGLPPRGAVSRVDQVQAQPKRSLFAVAQEQAVREQVDNQGLAARLTERIAAAEVLRTEGAALSVWEALRERASIPQALPLLLERLALRQPALMVIEDLQWMDPDSRKVLEAVIAAAPEWPLFVLVTARPETDWTGERLSLSPLSDADGRALAAYALQATSVEPGLSDWLLSRAGGNPLFILVYCRALRDASAVVVDPASDEARWSGPPPSLPLSVQELLLAQVDRLGQETKDLLQRGAVIGTTFPNWLLNHLYGGGLLPGQLNGALDRAARRSAVAPPPPAEAYTFSSQSLHDATYATLSHALRRDWHEQVGDYLTEADEPTRYERLEQIAYHYGRSGSPYKAAHFTRLAGDKARARQADEAALEFYAQTLAVADGEGASTEQRLAYEGTGDIRALQGESEAAQAAYQAALALQEAPSTDAPRLKAKLALLSPLVGPTDLEALEKAWQMLPPSDPLRPWLGAARVWLCAERGEAEAVTLCRELLPTAGEPVEALLQEALGRLDVGEPLFPYADLFTFFARSRLRLYMSGGEP
jgi:class 3 adenylate cyclase